MFAVTLRRIGVARGARAPQGENKNGGLNLERLVVSAPPGRAIRNFYWAGQGRGGSGYVVNFG